MPQFDKITFFTQIFWLTIIFFGFYFLTLQIFLPKIAAVLKSRKKKLSSGSTGVFNLNEEQFSVVNIRNTFVQNFIEDAKSSLGSKVSLGVSWLSFYLTQPNNKDLVNTQSKYLDSYGNLLTKYYLMLSSK